MSRRNLAIRFDAPGDTFSRAMLLTTGSLGRARVRQQQCLGRSAEFLQPRTTPHLLAPSAPLIYTQPPHRKGVGFHVCVGLTSNGARTMPQSALGRALDCAELLSR